MSSEQRAKFYEAVVALAPQFGLRPSTDAGDAIVELAGEFLKRRGMHVIPGGDDEGDPYDDPKNPLVLIVNPHYELTAARDKDVSCKRAQTT